MGPLKILAPAGGTLTPLAWQGGMKYFASWEPHLLGQYFAHDSAIQGLTRTKSIYFFMSKKSFSA